MTDRTPSIKREYERFYAASPYGGASKDGPLFSLDWRSILAGAFEAGWRAKTADSRRRERATHSAAKKRVRK